MSYQDKKDQVWEKGKKIGGKDPDLYRKDSFGNKMYYSSYGKLIIVNQLIKGELITLII